MRGNEEVKKKSSSLVSKIGCRFHEQIERIKDERLLNGRSKNRVSTEKITNLIVRSLIWQDIFNNIVNAEEEEVNEFGL